MREVHVVPHSHWDREWYFTIEDSNALLVEHMDYLISYLEENEEFLHFVFDGQLSVIEDYLKYRPEMEQRLKKLIANQRIFIGPWFTQCDTLNPKLESVIRNLQYGITLASKYGKTMNIGYLPDAFGQNAFLPAIFKQCQIDYSILQRGIKNETAEKGINFNWIAPNGEEIKTNYIYFGYGPGKFLSQEKNYLDEKLLPMLDKLDAMSSQQNLLLPSGGDQALIRTHFPDTIRAINQNQEKYQLKLSNYEQFMNSVDFSNANKIEGELYAPQKSRIHRTIHSQRMDIKILNTEVEKMLIEQLEPLLVIGKKAQLKLNLNVVDEIWRDLFDVHAHDSIGGCNSDATNSRVKTRLEIVKAKIEGQINLIAKKIAKISLGDQNGLIVFNLGNVSNKKMSARIFTKKPEFKLFDDKKEIEIVDSQQKIIDGGSKIEVTANGEKQVKLPDYYQTDIQFIISDVKFGYKALKIEELEQSLKNDKEIESINSTNILTKHYEITVTDTIKIKSPFETVTCGLAISTDAGDSYDYSFVDGEKEQIFTKIINPEIKKTKTQYQIKYQMFIENNDGEKQLIENKMIIPKTGKAITVSHQITNKLTNIRVRAIYQKAIKNQTHLADVGFGTITRVNYENELENWREKSYAEMPLAIYPFERFIQIDNFTILNSNVKEYQMLEDGVALTLYRSVGYLGKDDLTTRPGRASGINNVVVLTPDAQLLEQNLQIEYQLSMLAEDNYQLYMSETKNYHTYQNQSLNVFENRLDRFELPVEVNEQINELKIELPSELVLSCARVCSDGKIEYRLFNTKNKDLELDNIILSDLLGENISKSVVANKDFITIREQ